MQAARPVLNRIATLASVRLKTRKTYPHGKVARPLVAHIRRAIIAVTVKSSHGQGRSGR
jgi:hypothetical protein